MVSTFFMIRSQGKANNYLNRKDFATYEDIEELDGLYQDHKDSLRTGIITAGLTVGFVGLSFVLDW